jgi:outer membrane lipoprotein-sorting protein
MNTCSGIAALALAGLAASAFAQTDSKTVAKATPALDALVAAFAKSPALSGDVNATAKVGDSEEKYTIHFSIKRPRLARYEVKQEKGGGMAASFVADGKQMWTIDSSQKIYFSEPIEEGSQPICPVSTSGLRDLLQAYFDASGIAAGKTASPWKARLESATASETTVGGEACDVVKLKSDEGTTSIAISKKSGLPQQVVDEMGTEDQKVLVTWDLTKLDASAKLEDASFAFAAPEGYKKTEGPPSPEDQLLAVGTEAPDIAGDSPTAGKRLKLSDYRGKVVLLNFWFEH